MIKKLLYKIDSITIAALLVAISSLASRFLGIFRDRILASEFGAGQTLDVYYAAFRIPDLIFNLIVLGALSAGFIPVFTRLLKKHFDNNNEEAWQVASIVLNLLGIALVVLNILGIIFAPFLMKLIAPGFSPEQQKLASDITRIMFLSPLFLGISSILGGILQSFKRFFIYSLAPIMYNLGIVFGALFLVPKYGVFGLAYGVVIGAFFHMLIQIPTVFRLGFNYRLIFDYKNKHVRKIILMMIPRSLSLAVNQVNLLVITIIASTLVTGSLTVFNLANNLQTFPVGIFGISFAIAAFPTLSAVAFDKKKLVYNFSNTFRKILFFIVPSSVLLLTLRAQIIRVVLGAGNFNWEDTVLTINTMGFFTISLFAQATIPLLVRIFYARQNSSTPFFIGLGSAALNVVLSFYFSSIYGVAGLALAFSISTIFNFFTLWLVLRFEIGNMDESKILNSVIKFSIASLAAGYIIQISKNFVVDLGLVNMTKTFGVFTQGFIAGIFGLAVYLLLCAFMRSEELYNFWGAIVRKFNWKKVETGDRGEARGI